MINVSELNSKTNNELIDLIELDVLDLEADVAARRILKDRLEGLEATVKGEVLADKIVGA